MAPKKQMKGGFFNQFDMMKIINYGELVNANQPSMTNNIDFLKEAKPVMTGLDKESSTVSLNNSQNAFLPQYGGAKPTAKPKPKPKAKPKPI